MATTMLEAIQYVFEEMLGREVMGVVPENDPFWRHVAVTSAGVVKDAFGRNWQRKHPFFIGSSGAIRWAPTTGPSTNPTLGAITQYGEGAAYPGLSAASQPGYFWRTITLKKALGIMFIDLDLIRAAASGQSRTDEVGDIIKGTARQAQWMRSQAFWSDAPSGQNNKGTIGVVDSSVIAYSNTSKILRVRLKNTSARRFIQGQKVQVLDATAATPWSVIIAGDSASPLFVENIHYLKNEVWMRNLGGADLTGVVADNDHIVPADSGDELTNYDTFGPSGINDWFKATGTIYGIPLDLPTVAGGRGFPEFSSLIIASLGQAWDDSVSNKIHAHFEDSYAGLADIDTVAATSGVINGSYEGQVGRDRWERQGEWMKVLQGRKDPIKLGYNGKEYMVLNTPFIADGVVYGMKIKGNIKMYVPPRLPNSRSRDEFDNVVEFTNPVLSGTSSIWKARHNSDGQVTEKAEAPFDMHYELTPSQLQGYKVGGVTEVKLAISDIA